MANYYMDTEFLEGTQKIRIPFTNISVGNTKDTIDLISIGIVSEDNSKYYAISKDFNLKEAWNRYDLKINKQYPKGSEYLKVYWIRDNVLKPICKELSEKEGVFAYGEDTYFTYKTCKRLINKYGKTNKQIAKEVIEFINYTGYEIDPVVHEFKLKEKGNPEFYSYYGAYDWVVFCWLFGKMIDLPNGFPMYSHDLKSMLDTKAKSLNKYIDPEENETDITNISFTEKLKLFRSSINYPKQINSHNALSDAVFNKKLHEFLINLNK